MLTPMLGWCSGPTCTNMASFSPYLAEAMQVPGRDRGFSEAINHNMQVPDRLAVGGGPPSARGREEEAESRRRSKEPPVSYNMHIPERLTYTGKGNDNRQTWEPRRASPSQQGSKGLA